MYTDNIRRFKDAVRRKRLEKWRVKSWFLLYDNAPAHRTVFVKDFSAQNNVTTLQHLPYSPGLVPTDFFTCSLNWNQHWRDGAFVILLTSLRMRRKSWKGFHKTASRNVSKTFTVAGRRVQSHKKIFWRKCSLNDCTVLHLSKIKRFWEHSETTTYVKVNLSWRTKLHASDFEQWQSSGTMEIYNEGRIQGGCPSNYDLKDNTTHIKIRYLHVESAPDCWCLEQPMKDEVWWHWKHSIWYEMSPRHALCTFSITVITWDKLRKTCGCITLMGQKGTGGRGGKIKNWWGSNTVGRRPCEDAPDSSHANDDIHPDASCKRKPQPYSWEHALQEQADKNRKLLQLLTAAVRANWVHLHNKLLKFNCIFTYDRLLTQSKVKSLTFKFINLSKRVRTQEAGSYPNSLNYNLPSWVAICVVQVLYKKKSYILVCGLG